MLTFFNTSPRQISGKSGAGVRVLVGKLYVYILYIVFRIDNLPLAEI